MHFEGDALVLRDGGLVTCGVDAQGHWIASVRPGGLEQRVRLPRWSGGVGGLELVASADERFVALLVYSGQSSQGFEVFALQPELVRIAGLAETYGHGSAPVFSPDGQWLLAVMDTERRVRNTDQHFEVLQDDDATDVRVVVDWAHLHVLRLSTTVMQSVPVGVEIPLSTDLDVVDEWNVYAAIRFADNDCAILRMPWGEDFPVRLPPDASITSRGFVDS